MNSRLFLLAAVVLACFSYIPVAVADENTDACYTAMNGVCINLEWAEDEDMDEENLALMCSAECQTVLKNDECTAGQGSGDDEFDETMNALKSARISGGGTTQGWFFCECLTKLPEGVCDDGVSEDCCLAIFGNLGCADATMDYPDLAEYKEVTDGCNDWLLSPPADAQDCVDGMKADCAITAEGPTAQPDFMAYMNAGPDFSVVCKDACQGHLKGKSCAAFAAWDLQIEGVFGEIAPKRLEGQKTTEAYFTCGCKPVIEAPCKDMTANEECCTTIFLDLMCTDAWMLYDTADHKAYNQLFTDCYAWRDAEQAPAPTAAPAAAPATTTPASDSAAGALSVATGLVAVVFAALA